MILIILRTPWKERNDQKRTCAWGEGAAADASPAPAEQREQGVSMKGDGGLDQPAPEGLFQSITGLQSRSWTEDSTEKEKGAEGTKMPRGAQLSDAWLKGCPSNAAWL